MAFVKLEDQFGEVEIILFPKSYQEQPEIWQRDKVVLVKGKINARDRNGNQSSEIKIMVDSAQEVSHDEAASYAATGKKLSPPKGSKRPAKIPKASAPETRSKLPERVYIRLASTNDEETLLSLKQTLDQYHGSTEVVLVLGESDQKQAIKLPGGIDKQSDGVGKLKELVGTQNLVIK